MHVNKVSYLKVKKKYLKFLKSQEVLSEPFRDKIGQLKNYYFPICKMIHKTYLSNKKTKIIGLAGGQGSGKSTISNILKIIKLNKIIKSVKKIEIFPKYVFRYAKIIIKKVDLKKTKYLNTAIIENECISNLYRDI